MSGGTVAAGQQGAVRRVGHLQHFYLLRARRLTEGFLRGQHQGGEYSLHSWRGLREPSLPSRVPSRGKPCRTDRYHQGGEGEREDRGPGCREEEERRHRGGREQARRGW